MSALRSAPRCRGGRERGTRCAHLSDSALASRGSGPTLISAGRVVPTPASPRASDMAGLLDPLASQCVQQFDVHGYLPTTTRCRDDIIMMSSRCLCQVVATASFQLSSTRWLRGGTRRGGRASRRRPIGDKTPGGVAPPGVFYLAGPVRPVVEVVVAIGQRVGRGPPSVGFRRGLLPEVDRCQILRSMRNSSMRVTPSSIRARTERAGWLEVPGMESTTSSAYPV